MAERDDLITRRELLRRSAFFGAAVVGGGALLSASGCPEGGEEKLTCTDTSGLDQGQIQTRKSLKYSDSSPKKDQTCANCNFYKAGGQNQCGTCTVVPGPIHPDGWCSSWAAKQG